ncbi:MAG: hypothetical protein HYY06_33030 [Deltaproteobacteria bacterium]|nr:hypothetical protein [Deltaproteobacteria bacterium]
MRQAGPLVLFGLLLSCGGGNAPRARDWSDESLLDRAIDFCLKNAACTEDRTPIAECVETTVDLQALPSSLPTRRDLEELVELRACYNRATTCQEVLDCAGVPTDDEEPRDCDPATFGASCATRMGVSLLRHCVNGAVIETDCTKLGLTCAFDSEGKNSCVAETCNPGTYDMNCDEESGNLNMCGSIDGGGGNMVYQYACGAIGMGCAVDLGTEDPGDEQAICTGREELCDPAATAAGCEGLTLTACIANFDGSGNMARWDCAAGAIHRLCFIDPASGGGSCAVTTDECDPALDQGSCDGTSLFVCVDGTMQTIDCREHGIATCKPGTPALCAESREDEPEEE